MTKSLKNIKKIILVGHDNEGSAQLFEEIYSKFPDVEFFIVICQGLYYKKTFIQSVMKLFREASWLFCAYRAFELVRYRLFSESLVQKCKRNNLKIHFTNDINSEGTCALLTEQAPDLIVSLYTMQIYKAPVITIPKYGLISSHPSLLPAYRGLEVFFWVLANNEPYTGVSVFFVTPQVDEGKVFEQTKIDLKESISVQKLYHQVTIIAGKLLVQGIRDIDNETVIYIPSVEKKSYYPMPTRKSMFNFFKNKKKFY